MANPEGILLIDKPRGVSSFHLVRRLRRHLNVQKIGHAGTLDPFATGVMILLVGRTYTRQSNQFLEQDKEYIGRLRFGQATDTYDCEGSVTQASDLTPSKAEVEQVLTAFQGAVEQIPPMFSAKKIQGKKLYELARQGKTVERQPIKVQLHTELLAYNYPYLTLRVTCSKGTYLRTLAHDIGQRLGCGAHLVELQRSRSGRYTIDQCLNGALLDLPKCDLAPYLRRTIEL